LRTILDCRYALVPEAELSRLVIWRVGVIWYRRRLNQYGAVVPVNSSWDRCQDLKVSLEDSTSLTGPEL
jgi:hypothetical protein